MLGCGNYIIRANWEISLAMDNEADCCCKVVRERGGEDDYLQVARPYLNLLGRVIGFLFLYPHDQLFSPRPTN